MPEKSLWAEGQILCLFSQPRLKSSNTTSVLVWCIVRLQGNAQHGSNQSFSRLWNSVFLVWYWGFFKEVPYGRTITGCSLCFSMETMLMVEEQLVFLRVRIFIAWCPYCLCIKISDQILALFFTTYQASCCCEYKFMVVILVLFHGLQ